MYLRAKEEKEMDFCELTGVSATLFYLRYDQITKQESALKQSSLS